MSKSISTMYEEIMEVSDSLELTAWETEFLDDIEFEALDSNLTPRQRMSLERIYDKACKSPH